MQVYVSAICVYNHLFYYIYTLTYIQTYSTSDIFWHVKLCLCLAYNSLTVMFLFQCWQQHVCSWLQVKICENVVSECLHLFSTYSMCPGHTWICTFLFVILVVFTERVITCDHRCNVQRLSCGMTELCNSSSPNWMAHLCLKAVIHWLNQCWGIKTFWIVTHKHFCMDFEGRPSIYKVAIINCSDPDSSFSVKTKVCHHNYLKWIIT